jgi:hypothetical protein
MYVHAVVIISGGTKEDAAQVTEAAMKAADKAVTKLAAKTQVQELS